jgi:hypothetical protein
VRPHEHIAIAQRNETFYARLDKTAQGDWAMTVLFYAALHYVDSYLVQYLGPPSSHAERDDFSRRFPVLRGVRDAYRALKDFSTEARYRGHLFTRAELDAAEADQLARIKAAIPGAGPAAAPAGGVAGPAGAPPGP